MYPLSNEADEWLQKCAKKLTIDGNVWALPNTKESQRMLHKGYLNLIEISDDGKFAFKIEDFQKLNLSVKFQESMQFLDTSEVVEIDNNGGALWLFHWNGFRSEIDTKKREVVSQEYTK